MQPRHLKSSLFDLEINVYWVVRPLCQGAHTVWHIANKPTKDINVWAQKCFIWPRFFSLPSEVCSVDCGTHGVCMGGACRCEEGWTGAGCDQRVCNPLCIKHGTCKDGKCQCHQGWNGEHCTIGKHLYVCVCVRACVEVCVFDVCLRVNTWVCTETPAPKQTKLAAPSHFVKGMGKWEVEAKGRP